MFLALYFVIYIAIVWVGGGDLMLWSVVKDLVFVGLFVCTAYIYRDGIRKMLAIATIQKLLWIVSAWLLRSIVYSLGLNGDTFKIVSGIKYTVRPILILVGGVCIGGGLALSTSTQDIYSIFGSKSKFESICRALCIGVGVVMVLGLLLQLLKLVRPDWISTRGYGPVGDYVMGAAPPLYYRTGPGGAMRLQGLFAGPNNYAYFLVAVFPVMWMCTYIIQKYHIRPKSINKRLLALWIIFVVSAMWTLSRAVIIGCGVQLLLLIYMYKPVWRKYLVYIVSVGFLSFLVLSIYKRGSTIAHFEAWISGGQAFLNNMWGYGLGSSGPAVHLDGIYLPENQYLQYVLDTGWWGGVCVIAIVYILVKSLMLYMTDEYQGGSTNYLRLCVQVCILSMIGMMLIGLFLHVFEDSMVNYMVLFPVGIIFGLAIAMANHKN